MKKLFLLMLLLAGMSQAQTAVTPIVNSHVQLFNGAAPCSGCLLDTFSAGTTTPLVTYSESTGTTPNANPVVADTNGFVTVYLTLASYKFRLRTAAGATLWTQDNVSPVTPLSTFAGITSTGNVIIKPSTAATSLVNQSSPTFCIDGFYFSVSSLTDSYCFQDVLSSGAAPTSTLNITHTGSGGASTVNVPGNLAVGAGIVIGAGGTIQFGIGGAQLSGAGTSTVTVGSAAGVADKQIQARTVSITGATSGAVALAAPAVAGSNTATFPAATGNVVLDSATQTLTNKTVTGTGSGNSVTLLSSQGATGGLVGTGADATVYTFTIPANTIQAGKGFRIKVVGFHSVGATNTTYKIIIGTTTTATVSSTSGNNHNWTMSIYNAAGVQNSQFYEATTLEGAAVLVNTFGTAAENFANAITVKFTFNVAATDQYSGKLFSIELIQ